jgi:transposase/5-methylcytosine-specific restriction endonuclease McrA
MDKDSLELLLSQGLSVERIAKRFGKDPSTISYWLKKHGLESSFIEKHAAKGRLERAELEALVASGASVNAIAKAVHRSPTTVRHWLAKYGLETSRTVALRLGSEARDEGRLVLQRNCRHHGLTNFWLEGRGTYRCARCRQEAVVRRRRKVKEILIQEAGGACVLCGYGDYPGALEFHHLDPSDKAFSVSATGVTRSLERARTEARKCTLLCSNCHAEVEGGYKTLPQSPPA